MGLEAVTYIDDLDVNNPVGASDPKSQGDDHIRNIKTALKNSFPSVDGVCDFTPAEATGLKGSAAVTAITGNTSPAASTFNYSTPLSNVTASGAATITLPAASAVAAGKGRRFYNSTLQNVQIAPDGTDTIAGVNANFRIPSHSMVCLVSDGVSAWLVTVAPKNFTGQIIEMAADGTYSGYEACDGAAISRTGFAGLFAVIGTTFGVGDGSTTFNKPNYQRRTSVGSGGTGTATLGNAIGDVGGEEGHVLITNELPPLVAGRRFTGANETNTAGTLPYLLFDGTQDHPVTPTGISAAHNTIQPSIVMAKYIKT